MKIEHAIENLSNTLKYPNQVKYLNIIIEWINAQENINVNENHLFAKLFIHKLNDIKCHDKDFVVNKFNEAAMIDVLQLELDDYYKQFTETLNDNHTLHIYDKNGIQRKHFALKTKEEQDMERLSIKNMSKDDVEVVQNGYYKKEDVRNRLNNMISNALFKYQ